MNNIDIIKIRRKLLKITPTRPPGACWTCNRYARDGYPEIMYKKRTYKVSRLMVAVFRNSEYLLTDSTKWVLHKCDNKKCVNPEHLYVGTWVENNMDTALRDPAATKQFMETSAKIFAKKYGIKNWSKIRSVEEILKKVKDGTIDIPTNPCNTTPPIPGAGLHPLLPCGSL